VAADSGEEEEGVALSVTGTGLVVDGRGKL
jgi:hypothetical protein